MPHGRTICGVRRSIYVIFLFGITKPMNLINFGSKFKFQINCLVLCHRKINSRQHLIYLW